MEPPTIGIGFVGHRVSPAKRPHLFPCSMVVISHGAFACYTTER